MPNSTGLSDMHRTSLLDVYTALFFFSKKMRVDYRPKYGSGAGGLFSLPFFLLSLPFLLLGTLYSASGPCYPLLYVTIMDTLDVWFFSLFGGYNWLLGGHFRTWIRGWWR